MPDFTDLSQFLYTRFRLPQASDPVSQASLCPSTAKIEFGVDGRLVAPVGLGLGWASV